MAEFTTITEADREFYADVLAARGKETRTKAFIVPVNIIIVADDAQTALNTVEDMTEDCHNGWGVRAIYYSNRITPCEVDEEGDLYSDSLPEGFSF